MSQYILKWTDSNGDTLVHIAVKAGNLAAVKRLVSWQVNPRNNDTVLHCVNNQDRTPIELAETCTEIKQALKEMLSRIDKYAEPFDQTPAVLIFYTVEGRPRAEKEAKQVIKFGEALGASPKKFSDFDKNKIIDEIEIASKTARCLIVAIMCHGKCGRIKLADGTYMEVSDIIKAMDDPSMNGKPKVGKMCTN